MPQKNELLELIMEFRGRADKCGWHVCDSKSLLVSELNYEPTPYLKTNSVSNTDPYTETEKTGRPRYRVCTTAPCAGHASEPRRREITV